MKTENKKSINVLREMIRKELLSNPVIKEQLEKIAEADENASDTQAANAITDKKEENIQQKILLYLRQEGIDSKSIYRVMSLFNNVVTMAKNKKLDPGRYNTVNKLVNKLSV